mmetsp:Transcript_16187/g.50198  ORF Transcript_16187/g.50198 Transcript_16187/m.50198 type:complete len:206 (-) Transcript_16187:822-1439(-)
MRIPPTASGHQTWRRPIRRRLAGAATRRVPLARAPAPPRPWLERRAPVPGQLAPRGTPRQAWRIVPPALLLERASLMRGPRAPARFADSRTPPSPPPSRHRAPRRPPRDAQLPPLPPAAPPWPPPPHGARALAAARRRSPPRRALETVPPRRPRPWPAASPPHALRPSGAASPQAPSAARVLALSLAPPSLAWQPRAAAPLPLAP